MNKKFVIYTAIFGKKDKLLEPKFVPADSDFVCFTDQPFRSNIWQIQRVDPPAPSDFTRSNRYYKILAHRVLPEYETSIYVDGNVLIVGDVTKLAREYLKDANMAVFDHTCWRELPISSLREELAQLLEMERVGKHQEDATLVRRQVQHYTDSGFPDNVGLSWNLVLIRKHNASDVVKTMEAWWQELTAWSKRDQVSFNYVAWKTELKFSYIPLDGSLNPYTKRLNHYLPPLRKIYAYFLGAVKRVRHLFLGRT